jgi:hypothetical protein
MRSIIFFLIIKKNNMGNKSSSKNKNIEIDSKIIFHFSNTKKYSEKLQIFSVNNGYNNLIIKYSINKKNIEYIKKNIPFEIEFIHKNNYKKEHYIFSQNFKHDSMYKVKSNKDMNNIYLDYYNLNKPNCKLRFQKDNPKLIIYHQSF